MLQGVLHDRVNLAKNLNKSEMNDRRKTELIKNMLYSDQPDGNRSMCEN